MTGAVAGEWLKVLKRPAVYVLLVILLALQVTLLYFLFWIFLHFASRQGAGGIDPRALLYTYYPINFVRYALSNSGFFGGVIALILGVLAVGSEYGWNTVKTMFIQRPGRLQIFAAKSVVIAACLLVFAILFFAVGAVTSLALVLIDGKPVQFPEVVEIVAGLGATWFIWCWYAAFGSMLAYLFKQTGLAIGIGLAYFLVIEAILLNVLQGVGGEVGKTISKFFPGPNAASLIRNFGGLVHIPREGQAAPALVGTGEALVALVIFTAAALAVSALVVRNRDVT